jgi:large subunit ribosomal protein L10
MKENPRAVIVEDFKERLSKAKIAIVADYKGLTVQEMESFRRDLREKGAQLKILKNTLARRAFEAAEIPANEEALSGQVAFILGYEDAVSGPQATKVFAKKHKELVVRAGLFEGEWVGPEVVQKLASIPNKETLRAMLLLLFQGPQRKLLSLLSAIPREFLATLEGLSKKKEESGPAPEEAAD